MRKLTLLWASLLWKSLHLGEVTSCLARPNLLFCRLYKQSHFPLWRILQASNVTRFIISHTNSVRVKEKLKWHKIVHFDCFMVPFTRCVLLVWLAEHAMPVLKRRYLVPQHPSPALWDTRQRESSGSGGGNFCCSARK